MKKIKIKDLSNSIIAEGGVIDVGEAMYKRVISELKNDDVELELNFISHCNFYCKFLYMLNLALQLTNNPKLKNLTVKSHGSFNDFYKKNEQDIINGMNEYELERVVNTQGPINELFNKTNENTTTNLDSNK